MFLTPDWEAPANIKAYTTLRRQGGISLPPYDDFNLAAHVGDNPEHVATNRQRLATALGLPEEPIWLKQTHSTIVVEALPKNRDTTADASFTTHPHGVCAVLTADCLPILLCDKNASQVAAVHAGWRGLADGVIEATLQTFSIPKKNILAWLGPAIGPQQFEVGKEVYDIFVTQNAQAAHAFTTHTQQTWLADIYALARLRLRAQGVTAIYGGNFCTFTEADRFFSYRRDQGRTGRMASLIWLET